MRNILALLKDISNIDWPMIFSQIEKTPDSTDDGILPEDRQDLLKPLVLVGPPPQRGAICIKNDFNLNFQVAVSGTTLPEESPAFLHIKPSETKMWQGDETGQKIAFFALSAFVAMVKPIIKIAIVKPGSYQIRKSQSVILLCNVSTSNRSIRYSDHNIRNVADFDPDHIAVKNNLRAPICVMVTMNLKESEFFDLASNEIRQWPRSSVETVFIKYSSSDALLTNLGLPGHVLHVDKQR